MSAAVRFNPSTGKYYIMFEGFTIETTVTDKASVAEEWLVHVYSKYGQNDDTTTVVVGLDTEWMPHEKPSKMKTAILQLCVETTCLIFQLFHMDDVPDRLKRFLMDAKFTFVGVSVKNDIKKLKKEYGLECRNGVDVVEVANKEWPTRFVGGWGLKRMAEELVGLHMKKPKQVCKSQWHARDLTMEQLEYACLDAYVSFRIGHKLLVEDMVVMTHEIDDAKPTQSFDVVV